MAQKLISATEATRPHVRCRCRRETMTSTVAENKVHQITARVGAPCCAAAERLQSTDRLLDQWTNYRHLPLARSTVPHSTIPQITNIRVNPSL